MIDLRQTPSYAKYMQAIGWKIDYINNTYCFIKDVFLFGKFVKIQRPRKYIIAKTIKIIEKKYKPTKIVLEPNLDLQKEDFKELIKLGFKEHTTTYLPSKTLIINLDQSNQKLLSEMHPKTRYNIKVAQKNKVKIEIANNISAFSNLWAKQREGLTSLLYSQKGAIEKMFNIFGKNINLLLATKNNQLLGGILLPNTSNISYYTYAACTPEGKKLHAPTLLVWEAIQLAKKLKLKQFDFEGIYDDRFPINSWRGFSKFKKTFGGKEILYPASFTKTNVKNIFR